MTRAQQKKFARQLSKTIAEEVCDLIENRTIPEDWDGHELRCLLAEMHEASARMSCIRAEPRCGRAKAYRRTRHQKGFPPCI